MRGQPIGRRYYHRTMTRWFDRDRAHGAGLPANLDTDRLRQRMAEHRARRFASIGAVLRAGFEPVGEGIVRRGHALWALKSAVDGDGYVLIRMRDEPAPGVMEREAQMGGHEADSYHGWPQYVTTKLTQAYKELHAGNLDQATQSIQQLNELVKVHADRLQVKRDIIQFALDYLQKGDVAEAASMLASLGADSTWDRTADVNMVVIEAPDAPPEAEPEFVLMLEHDTSPMLAPDNDTIDVTMDAFDLGGVLAD